MAIEKTFLDRVPTYPGRVKLTHVGGDLYDMERADEPVVAGTPIDKATFDSIVQSRLTGRFYQPTVKQNTASSRTGVTANPIPRSGWVLNGDTAAQTGGYILTASSTYSAGHSPEKAVDGDVDTSWESNAGTDHTFSITLPSAITIKKVKMAMRPDSYTYTLTTKVQGSENGSTWVDLLTTTDKDDNPDSLVEYTLSNTGLYRYYRLSFSVSSATSVVLFGFEISEYDVILYTNAFTESAFPSKWDAQQIALVQTPNNVATLAVTSNTLNGVPVNTILQPSKRYELRYTGSAFVAKEV